jgi:hypothetical protein
MYHLKFKGPVPVVRQSLPRKQQAKRSESVSGWRLLIKKVAALCVKLKPRGLRDIQAHQSLDAAKRVKGVPVSVRAQGVAVALSSPSQMDPTLYSWVRCPKCGLAVHPKAGTEEPDSSHTCSVPSDTKRVEHAVSGTDIPKEHR